MAKATDRRKYTLEEKAQVLVLLDQNRGNIAKTSRDTGIHENNIRNWRDSRNPALQKVAREKRRNISDLIEQHIYDVLTALDGKIKDATYPNLVTALNVLVTKWQTLNNMPTEVIIYVPQIVVAARQANINLEDFLRASLIRLASMAEERLGVMPEAIQIPDYVGDGSDAVEGEIVDESRLPTD